METNLVVVCAVAFLAVLVLLSLLAALIRVITSVFADRDAEDKATMVSAIHAAVAESLPGVRVINVEELD